MKRKRDYLLNPCSRCGGTVRRKTVSREFRREGTVVTVRGGMEILTNVRVTVAAENVTHKDYRAHGSGVNEPGANFVAALEIKF